MLKKKASEMEQSDKVIPFPPGGKDKIDSFKERPNVTSDADELKPGFGDNIRDAYKKKGASREDAAKMIEAMDSPGGKEATKIFEKELGMKLHGDETFEEIMEIKRTGKHPRGEPKAEGGIIGLANGGPSDPSKRKFMKILGGLASIPILGRFITPVKQAAEVAPAAVEAVKGVPSYFFKLADKIRRLGEDAPGLTSIERETGKKFKNYEMVENTDGEIVIKKNTTGSSVIGDDVVEGIKSEEVMVYKPKKSTADGVLNEDYQEITVKPDYEGKMKDVEDGLETVEDILKEVGEKKIKRAGGGIAYLLGE
jgi:ribosome-binding protein aMBF1 (putative translation factor)